MSDLVARTNLAIDEHAPVFARLLSPLARRCALPMDIPVQADDARGKTFNGTIGIVTDGRGGSMPLPSMAAAVALEGQDFHRAFLYSPVAGLPEVRQRWRQWQRRGQPEERASSLPVVTVGLAHGLSLVADLFGCEGRVLAIPTPYWGNYRQTFTTRTGTRVVSAAGIRDGGYNCTAIEEALAGAGLAAGEPALALLNLPSNPGGYSLTGPERAAVRASLMRVADERPLLVLCDDAYAGLVYEPDVPAESMYWQLVGCHPQLFPVKVDGATKEFSFFGGRVGFLTFPFEPGSPVAEALDSKASCLIRAAVGSPVATSQMILLQALRREAVADEVEAVRRVLAERYVRLRAALDGTNRELLVPQPFNSGCFALVELPEALGVTSEQVRQHLLAHHDTGLVSLGTRYVRIAHCSVEAEALPEMVRRLERAVAELSGRA